MESGALSVRKVFSPSWQLHVPFYQRTYVWNKKEQWEGLWSDLQDKADNRLLGTKPVPHYMGAIVLEPQPDQECWESKWCTSSMGNSALLRCSSSLLR